MLSFHSLRHSNASFRIQAGQNIKYIQGRLGHASINMTMDVYGHLFNDVDFNRKQVELLESVRKTPIFGNGSRRKPMKEATLKAYPAIELLISRKGKQSLCETLIIMERATGFGPATFSLGS
jgi:hypothetical protein